MLPKWLVEIRCAAHMYMLLVLLSFSVFILCQYYFFSFFRMSWTLHPSTFNANFDPSVGRLISRSFSDCFGSFLNRFRIVLDKFGSFSDRFGSFSHHFLRLFFVVVVATLFSASSSIDWSQKLQKRFSICFWNFWNILIFSLILV